MKKNLITTIVALALIAPWGALQALSVGEKAPALIGKTVPKGNFFILAKQASKPKVVNIFWIECIPCKEELPHLAKMEQAYPHADFYAVHSGINSKTGAGYSDSDVASYIEKISTAPKNIVWAGAKLYQREWKIAGYPATILLSKDNIIEAVLIGYNPRNTAKIEEFLERTSPQEIPERTSPQEILKRTSPQEIPERTSPQEIPERTSPQEILKRTSPQEIPERTSPQEIPERTSPQEIPERTSPQETYVR